MSTKIMDMENIGIQELLSHWDMEIFKDHKGNYYVSHDGGEDYFHGKILEYDSIETLPDCISDSLLEEELRDQGEFLKIPVKDYEEAIGYLKQIITNPPNQIILEEAKQRLQMMEGIMGNVKDDVPREKTIMRM